MTLPSSPATHVTGRMPTAKYRKLANKSPMLARLTGAAFAISLLVATGAGPPFDFERTYSTRGIPRLFISNVNGEIRVNSWEKSSITVRAITRNAGLIEDRVSGDEITVDVKKQFRPTRVDFEANVPPDTSLVLNNVIGGITVGGMKGHVSISSFQGDVRLNSVSSKSLDVRITTGNIYFDGELHEGGSYTLQTMKGDLDVTLPVSTPFNLNARSLSESINLGAFLSDLTSGNKGSKSVSGTYLRGGPRLNLTTYAGKILLHKK